MGLPSATLHRAGHREVARRRQRWGPDRRVRRAQFDHALEAERERHKLQWSEMRRGNRRPPLPGLRAAFARDRIDPLESRRRPAAPPRRAAPAPRGGRGRLGGPVRRQGAAPRPVRPRSRRLRNDRADPGPSPSCSTRSRPRDRVAITVDAAGKSSYTAIPSYQPRAKDESLESAQARLRYALAASFDKGPAEEFVRYCFAAAWGRRGARRTGPACAARLERREKGQPPAGQERASKAVNSGRAP